MKIVQKIMIGLARDLWVSGWKRPMRINMGTLVPGNHMIMMMVIMIHIGNGNIEAYINVKQRR